MLAIGGGRTLGPFRITWVSGRGDTTAGVRPQLGLRCLWAVLLYDAAHR
jgi:hypothetical protein